jgi:hypothetical protein
MHIVREELAREDDARALLRDLSRSEADILPDLQNQILEVRIHGMANARFNRAIQHLLTHLNESAMEYPSTELKLFFTTTFPPAEPQTCQINLPEIRRSELAAFPARLVVVVSWSPNGRWLTAGNVEEQLFLMDPSREAAAKPTTVNPQLTTISWSPDSQRIALGCSYHAIEIRDVESRQLLNRQKLRCHGADSHGSIIDRSYAGFLNAIKGVSCVGTG